MGGKEYNVRVASRYYKGPELLVGIQRYDYSLDMWSLGCMLAGMVFRKEPFFQGADNNDQLVKIVYFLGTDELSSYIQKYKKEIEGSFDGQTLFTHCTGRLPLGKQARKPWSKYINDDNRHLACDEIIDLISKMLILDHAARILPIEAMQHHCFHPSQIDPDATNGGKGSSTVRCEDEMCGKASSLDIGEETSPNVGEEAPMLVAERPLPD